MTASRPPAARLPELHPRSRILMAAAAAVLVALLAPPARAVDNGCINCHQDLDEPLNTPVRKFSADIHAARGLSCQSCHGGDPTSMDMGEAMSPAKGFKAAPKNGLEVVTLCASCHSNAEYMHGFDPALRIDQLAEYRSSVHGKRLFGAGDAKVATCISCHGVHDIRAVRDPLSSVYPTRIAATCAACHADPEHMKSYKLPTDQYEKYKTSVHAELLYKQGDISAPTCNDCHGNHGAAPPAGGDVVNVCGQCHVFFKEYFLKSPHRGPFLTMGQCIHCHGNHGVQRPTDDFVGTGEKAVCVRCHREGDKGYVAAATIHDNLVSLRQAVAQGSELLDRAERAGMEISQARFELRDAGEALVKARSLVHTLDPARVKEMTDQGQAVAGSVEQKGRAALAELAYRRKGLLLSLVLVLGLMGGLAWKIKELSSRPPAP